MESLTVDANATYLATLRDLGGNKHRVLWNPTRSVQFAIPPDWRVSRQRDLTGASLDLTGKNSVAIGEAPLLLEGEGLSKRPPAPTRIRVIP